MLRWLWLSAAVVAVDQLSKWLAVKHLLGQPPLKIMPGFELSLAFNTGAAFSLFHDAGGWQNGFFIAVALGVSAFIVFSLQRMRQGELQTAVALALILGGAVGNVIDRVRQGFVVDFVHWFYQDWHWPHFNIADSAITVGAVLLVLDALGWRVFGRRAGVGK